MGFTLGSFAVQLESPEVAIKARPSFHVDADNSNVGESVGQYNSQQPMSTGQVVYDKLVRHIHFLHTFYSIPHDPRSGSLLQFLSDTQREQD